MSYENMRFKRDEPYRFEFTEPIQATFSINNTSIPTTGVLKIFDISLNGLKIETDLDIPLIEDITLTTKVKIGSYHFTLIGTIVWRKKFTPTMFQYGVKLLTFEHQAYLKKALIEYQKQLKNNSK